MISRAFEALWSALPSVAMAAAIMALATTPIAFAVLARLDWFQARRGRVLQKPAFSSVVVGMMLVMGIPAIFLAVVIKSRHFDERRYEFDPNQTLTVIDEGRGYQSREEIQAAIRSQMERLAQEKKELVEDVKKLDEAMLVLRASASQSPAVAQALPNVLQRLAGVRKAIKLDGPQQLMDFTAPPAELPAVAAQPGAPVATTPAIAAPALAAPPAGGGLTAAEIQTELATVPDAQKALAGFLPLNDLPPGWTVGKSMGPSGKARLETFNDSNLFEKINGRAESFIDYHVKGMAYTFYHPIGDESGEVQLYIFEMGSPLDGFGKYSAEKPDNPKKIDVGTDGYTAAGSIFFYVGPYYVQLVSNKDEPKYADFALELAKKVASRLAPKDAAKPSVAGGQTEAAATPEALFALLPPEPKRASPKYVAADVFGYSFLSDVFMADYQEKDATWQGFLRPYPTPEAAREVFEKYVAGAKRDGAEVKEIEAEGADKTVVCSSVGLIDVVFLKGNALGGANGATDAAPAEAFARSFAKSLPKAVPVLETSNSPAKHAGEAPEAGGDKPPQ